MADAKITELGANTAPVGADVMVIVDDVAGTPVTQKITLTNLATFLAPIASPTFTGTVTLPTGLTGVVRADSGVVSVDTDVTDIVAAASATAAGKVELATDAETNTGTDTTRAITPANLEAWTGSAQITTVGTLASPAMTTPALGTPASGVATNITGLVPANLVAGTLAARINLGEGADTATIGLEMDASMSADERYSGITIPGTAGATLAFGDLCYLDVTAGEWLLADADAASTSGDVVLGICVDASTDGAATSMLLHGTVRSAAFPASIALGAPLWISATAGDITATAPTGTDDVRRRVGFAVTVEPNTIYFNPSTDYVTHV